MHKSLISMFWMNKKVEPGNIIVFQKSQSSLSKLKFAKRNWPETNFFNC